MKTGMSKCSFFDDATGTVVQLNSIDEGKTNVKIKEVLETKNADGTTRFAGHHSLINITANDSDAALFTQLKAWEDAGTPLKFVSYGLEGHILWYRETPITVKENTAIAPGESNSFTVTMEQKGGDHSGFDGTQIWYGKNLFYGALGWEDADGDGKFDNLTNDSAGFNMSFANNMQSVNAILQGVYSDLYVKIVYPIANIPLNYLLKASANYTMQGSNSIVERSSSGIWLLGIDLLPNIFTAAVTVPNIYQIHFYVIGEVIANVGETSTFALPLIQSNQIDTGVNNY